ncbi:dihydrodipicolinate reductase [Roseibacterium sp. SDUM158017]|uniref:dihydrodipicolinate reductase n=1 Tax=Roseicyclus salinarum TaxID=3036773 RepID=UPI002414D362|nr:dihydrodipicolinate reductase [Roseibacterium sp. SDUM158017]MDG4650550.1 dihydrodipicolinate reductase [Roseibacterium sp. SDUM158017]
MVRHALKAPALAAGLTAFLLSAGEGAAEEFDQVSSRDTFVSLIEGRELRRFGIRLTVSPDGRIQGRAFGAPVTGQWDWDGGFFCRDLYWGSENLGFNCQLVQVDGETIRFTTDQGQGIYADLTLR